MTPSGRRSNPKTRKTRRTQYKKQHLQPKNQETSVGFPSKIMGSDIDFEGTTVDASSTSSIASACSTPKGQKFRIPEIRTCPPAPKKQRILSNCSLRRSPIAFFAPPDLELFFFFALGDISA